METDIRRKKEQDRKCDRVCWEDKESPKESRSSIKKSIEEDEVISR